VDDHGAGATEAAVRVLESGWLQDIATLPLGDEVTPGVTMADLLAFHTRPDDPSGATFHHNLAYGRGGPQGRSLFLSLYARTDPSERRPMVVFVHGGGWAGGDPWTHIRHAHALAAQGFVTATITYRLAAEAVWPASIEDVTTAVQWLKQHAATFGGDPGRVAVAGGSAGGHLSAMVALTTEEVQAAVLFYPAVDLEALAWEANAELHAVVVDYFGDQRHAASPVNHVHAGAPPILTLTGALDQLTTAADIERFHKLLDDAGVTNTLVVLDDADHGFDLVLQHWQETFDVLAQFLRQALGARP
jgi:acetyl esterase/lipase